MTDHLCEKQTQKLIYGEFYIPTSTLRQSNPSSDVDVTCIGVASATSSNVHASYPSSREAFVSNSNF